MKYLRLFEEHLNEFNYGKKLFADPDTPEYDEGKYKKWIEAKYGKSEDDTPEEEAALRYICDYVEHGDKYSALQAVKFIRKHGKNLKKKFGEILDPEYQTKLDTIYRGATTTHDFIISAILNDKDYQKRIMPGGDLYKFIMENPANWYSKIDSFRSSNGTNRAGNYKWGGRFWIGINNAGVQTSQNNSGFLSFATERRDAKSFSSPQKALRNSGSKRWPVISEVDFNKVRERTYMNPWWIKNVGEYDENEVWLLGKSFDTKRIWVRSPYQTGIWGPGHVNWKDAYPIAKALYFQHIDAGEFNTALKRYLTTNGELDRRKYFTTKIESYILSPPY
tara:strand:- start:50 stop:1051 length:1002 start_codon:yes stop_codon:yes gene_type:complete